jgi:hypothetical protein
MDGGVIALKSFRALRNRLKKVSESVSKTPWTVSNRKKGFRGLINPSRVSKSNKIGNQKDSLNKVIRLRNLGTLFGFRVCYYRKLFRDFRAFGNFFLLFESSLKYFRDWLRNQFRFPNVRKPFWSVSQGRKFFRMCRFDEARVFFEYEDWTLAKAVLSICPRTVPNSVVKDAQSVS